MADRTLKAGSSENLRSHSFSSQNEFLRDDLRYVRGIGPKRAETLAKIEIRNLRDLLYHFPQRYENRSQFLTVDQLEVGETATLKLEVLSARLKPIPRLPMVELQAGDETGAITAIWYRQAYLLKQFTPGKQILLYGRVDKDGSKIRISNPEFEFIKSDDDPVHTGRIVPVYPLTEGLYQKSLRTLLHDVTKTTLCKWSDPLSAEVVRSEKLMPLQQALAAIHFPANEEELEAARRRLIFDEFFSFQLKLQSEVRKSKSNLNGIPFSISEGSINQYIQGLPFTLTGEQQKALKEIQHDLVLACPMNRLLQGEVGSGKTVVAAFAFWAAKNNQCQSALLVPTEILAEQHFKTLNRFLEPLGVKTALLTKSTEKKRRERLVAELKQGKIDLIVGTHSILQDEIIFSMLGLVVIDEQHKFGVDQRNKLLQRKPNPHLLIMTATPIPRSLALAVYANADLSSIRELPKGREPVKTYWISRQKQAEVWLHLREKLNEGRQAYIVFPLIEETEKADLKAAEKEYKVLKDTVFSDFNVALLHGKTSASERDRIMKGFASGEINLLVSTTVIEVGVDQPNASVMVIENAERFGLAQLHQLRGRIGRGKHASECYLFGEPQSDIGKARLRLLTKINDGFQIAEEDLKLRGPGDLWGERQSGAPHFRLAHPIWNIDILQRAKELAESIASEKSNASWVKKYLAETMRSL